MTIVSALLRIGQVDLAECDENENENEIGNENGNENENENDGSRSL